ncbi:MAG TPA: hypothetical protein VFV33_07520, partial [Gemmatimonadaceae bacterium]|nr:hypothetical protein [Gemmatimonadaceae bacterium]
VLDAVQRWANDDLRSLNGHIEFLLRAALKDAGRLPQPGGGAVGAQDGGGATPGATAPGDHADDRTAGGTLDATGDSAPGASRSDREPGR